jgi:hypothetical protein
MAARVANVILKAASAIVFGFFCYLVVQHGWDSKYLALLMLIAGLLSALRLRPALCVNAVMMLMTLGISLYVSELVVTVRDALAPVQKKWIPFNSGEDHADERAIAASTLGIPFDKRSRLEVLRELRANGIDAWPDIGPQVLFRGRPTSYQDSLIKINGISVLPLGGISNTTTVYCNENGYYVIYESDEHGFENPKNLWSQPFMNMAVIGDSYAHGACVKPDTSFASLIQHRYPMTLNLGEDGDGPLLELATLKEYVPPLHPKVVLWCYFEMNDMGELLREKQTFLTKYLTPGYTQDLIAKQPEIDQVLREYVEGAMEEFTLQGQLITFFKNLRDPLSHLAEFEEFIKLGHIRKTILMAFHKSEGEPQVHPPLPALSREDLDLFRKVLSEAKTTVAGWGGTLVFIYLPQYERYTNPEVVNKDRDQVLRIVSDLNLPLIDIEHTFETQGDTLNLFPFKRYGHYNENGNRVVAKEVLKFLDAMHLEASKKNDLGRS